MRSKLDALIIGAGPAGLMAADILSQAGKRVVVADAMASAARKFLMAGRGGLNLTHSEPPDAFLSRYGASSDFVRPWLEGFTPENLRRWATELGQETFIGSSGRVFPKAMKASPLLRAWVRRLHGHGVIFLFHHHLVKLVEENGIVAYFNVTNNGNRFVEIAANHIFLALGGASWPKLGSTGKWPELLAPFDVEITPMLASNCGVLAAQSDYTKSNFAGAVIKNIAVRESMSGQSRRGDLIITENGFEGTPIYALGPALRAAVAAGNGQMRIDFRPDLTLADIHANLARAKPKESRTSALKRLFKLPPAAITLLNDYFRAQNPSPSVQQLANGIHQLPIFVQGFAGLERAISTAGGVAANSLNPDLSLKNAPNISILGEMLDFDAPTGGYLLQACFASAHHGANALLAR